MRTIFIGLFIIAFLAGISAKMVNTSSTSWVGHVLNSLGLKQKRDEQKTQLEQIVTRFEKEKELFWQDYEDQQEYLKRSREQMESLSKMIQERMDRDSNMDLLRLKDLMNRFMDQNTLLIEKGKQLQEYNRERKKINQEQALKADFSSYASNVDRDRFLQSIRDKQQQQKDLIDDQMQENKELKDKIRDVQDQINQMHNNIAFKEDPQFVERLKSVSNKAESVLDSVKEKQERLKNINQENLSNIDSMRERMEDLKDKTRDIIDRNRADSQDQSQRIHQQVEDQMQRLKDRRER